MNRRWGLVAVLAGAVVAVVVAVVAATVYRADQRDRERLDELRQRSVQVRLEAESEHGQAILTWHAGKESESDVRTAMPWSHTLTVNWPAQSVAVFIDAEDLFTTDHITCRIFVDGKLVVEEDNHPITFGAQCSYQINF